MSKRQNVKMRCSILIPCYLRPFYLHHQLVSIARQNLTGLEYEIAVLNDGIEDETAAVVEEWVGKGLNVTYTFTGQRNAAGVVENRVPGFALNIGIQQSSAAIIILCGVEVYHLGESVRPIIEASTADPDAMATPDRVFDDDGTLWKCLNTGRPTDLDHSVDEMVARDSLRREAGDPFISNRYMPYFLAVRRERLLDIGGYDEDFTGIGVEDHDLVNRLMKTGCHYVFTTAQTVHLWHPNIRNSDIFSNPAYLHNLRLFRSRKDMIERNVGRKWGVLK